MSVTLGCIKLRKQRFQDLQRFDTSVIRPHGSWDTRCEVCPPSKSLPLLQGLLVICNERSYWQNLGSSFKNREWLEKCHQVLLYSLSWIKRLIESYFLPEMSVFWTENWCCCHLSMLHWTCSGSQIRGHKWFCRKYYWKEKSKAVTAKLGLYYASWSCLLAPQYLIFVLIGKIFGRKKFELAIFFILGCVLPYKE